MSQQHAPAPRLSVVLPGYNERENLPEAIARYAEGLTECGIEHFELIVVDDGSTDGTGALADEIARGDPRVRVIHHERNRGQIAAMLTGFAQARGQIVTHNGMDLPFDPRDTGRALAPFDEGADVVVVERADRASYGLARKVISRGNVLLLRLLFRTPFRDHNFAQFFRREVLSSITARSRGVSTLAPELIFRARRAGRRVVAITADYHPRERGKSSVGLGKVLHAVLETFRLRWLMCLPEPAAAQPRRDSESQIPDARLHTGADPESAEDAGRGRDTPPTFP